MARQYALGLFPFGALYINETQVRQSAVNGPGYLNDTSVMITTFVIDTVNFTFAANPFSSTGFINLFDITFNITIILNEATTQPVPVAPNAIQEIDVVLKQNSGDVVLSDYGGKLLR